jgi:hypothetical protein
LILFGDIAISIPLFGQKVSGVSVQDMLLRLPFLTPETKFSEQKWCKKLSLSASCLLMIYAIARLNKRQSEAIQQIFNIQYSIPACPGWV